MDRNNHGLSGKAFFYCRNGVKWYFWWKYDCRKMKKDVDRRDIRWYYRQALERRVDKSKTKFKKMKKVVDKEEWIWYSNMAVARERPVSSRTSSFTYGWFDNALCALRKDKTADKQINLQPDFVFLTYFVRCQIYTEHW